MYYFNLYDIGVRQFNMSCLCQDSEYVVAVRNCITEDRTLLNFHKGDIIRLQHRDGLEAGETHRTGIVL